MKESNLKKRIASKKTNLKKRESNFIIDNYQTKRNRRDVSVFLEYINFNLTTTSSIIVKNIIVLSEEFYYLLNYSFIKEIVYKLYLDWDIEKALLRKTLKNWYTNNINLFNKQYPDLLFNKQPSTITILKSFLRAYEMQTHIDHEIYSIYDVNKNTQLNYLKDRVLIRNNFFCNKSIQTI